MSPKGVMSLWVTGAVGGKHGRVIGPQSVITLIYD